MKIWFDITYSKLHPKTGGTSRVESELYKYFVKSNGLDVQFIAFSNDCESELSIILPDGKIYPVKKTELCNVFSPGDVFLSAGHLWLTGSEEIVTTLKNLCGVKICLFLYDLIPLLIPQWARPGISELFLDYLRFLSKNCDLLLLPSNSTASDVEREFLKHHINLPPLKYECVRLGDFSAESRIALHEKSVCGLNSGQFILYVSTIEARKNHRILYHVYHMICAQGYGDILPDMVFVGRIGWGVDDLLREISHDPVLTGKIKIIDKINDSELTWLYENAMFCVYPSYYEGWGLPVAEALSQGKVVIVSENSSLPEVGGDCTVYVNAFDAIGWRNEILRLIKDSRHRKILEDKVQLNYKSTKWSETCEKILEVISGKEYI